MKFPRKVFEQNSAHESHELAMRVTLAKVSTDEVKLYVPTLGKGVAHMQHIVIYAYV